MSFPSGSTSLGRAFAVALALLMFAAIPALASAQSPTDEQYECGVLGITTDGEECNDPAASTAGGDPGGDGSSTASATDGSSGGGPGSDTLPFTGLDVWAIAAIGLGLLAAGFALRRIGPATN